MNRPITIHNAQRCLRINRKAIAELASFVLAAENARPARGVNILFTDDATIRRYNKQFLHHDYPTDVISFPDASPSSVGDIVISTQQALAYASEHHISVPEELARYVIHGILHCLGYTDSSRPARARMTARQESLLRAWLRRRVPVCSSHPSSSTHRSPHSQSQ